MDLQGARHQIAHCVDLIDHANGVVVDIAEVYDLLLREEVDITANYGVEDVAHRDGSPAELLRVLLHRKDLGQHVVTKWAIGEEILLDFVDSLLEPVCHREVAINDRIEDGVKKKPAASPQPFGVLAPAALYLLERIGRCMPNRDQIVDAGEDGHLVEGDF